MAVTTKVCIKCNAKKPIEQFSWRNKKKGIRTGQCKVCHAAYRRQHYLDNQQKYIDKARRWNEENKEERILTARTLVVEYLLQHPCVDCGETDPIVLEFDHVRGTKFKTVSELMTGDYSLKRLRTEIDKCDVRCANCHRRKTAQERGWHIIDLLAKYKSMK